VKVLLSEQQLSEGVDHLAREIAQVWGSKSMTIVGVLTGCVVFLADLIRRLDMPLRVDFIQASSYRGGTMRGELTIDAALQPDIRDRHVLLVDDIFDTGHTLVEVVEQLRKCGPASLQTAVLLYKQGRQEVDVEPDFIGFQIPDEFVVGYGLDYRDEFRNLPHLAVLEPGDLVDAAKSTCGAGVE
jgi:hypoxanthine phosphoribosyltransferase